MLLPIFLDEPLGALDLKLRQEMQYELIRMKNELGITFIYVTHDQEEALTMSDTIVVMNQGYIMNFLLSALYMAIRFPLLNTLIPPPSVPIQRLPALSIQTPEAILLFRLLLVDGKGEYL